MYLLCTSEYVIAITQPHGRSMIFFTILTYIFSISCKLNLWFPKIYGSLGWKGVFWLGCVWACRCKNCKQGILSARICCLDYQLSSTCGIHSHQFICHWVKVRIWQHFWEDVRQSIIFWGRLPPLSVLYHLLSCWGKVYNSI